MMSGRINAVTCVVLVWTLCFPALVSAAQQYAISQYNDGDGSCDNINDVIEITATGQCIGEQVISCNAAGVQLKTRCDGTCARCNQTVSSPFGKCNSGTVFTKCVEELPTFDSTYVLTMDGCKWNPATSMMSAEKIRCRHYEKLDTNYYMGGCNKTHTWKAVYTDAACTVLNGPPLVYPVGGCSDMSRTWTTFCGTPTH